MGRPRKVEAPVAPGPHVLEIRFNGKIIHMQRVHSYSVDVLDDRFVATGIMKLPAEKTVEPVVEAPAVEAVVEPSEAATDTEDADPA